MIVQDQSDAISFMQEPRSHGSADDVETIETHISTIFLTGARAYKMKRAVKLPYVDFSTPERRLKACRREVELNGATAPEIYRGMRRITREGDGGLAFDGDGELVDAVVEMVRFDQECLFDRMAVAGKLTPDLMTDVAHTVAAFHVSAPVVHGQSGSANLGGVLDINEAGFATSHVFGKEEIGRIDGAFREALERHRARLDAREERGAVRRCHGDLHLRNICLFEGRAQLFDCIEFNEQIATVDVLYDLAFLLMDLWHRDLPGFANLVMNRYLDETGDEDGLVLVPFFMAVRAAVRAHVTATRIEEGSDGADELEASARSYRDLSLALLGQEKPTLVAIGGLSGSGKSTVAEALAPLLGGPPGARIIESDRTRKAMFRVPASTRLGAEAYTPQVSEKVYAALVERAGKLLGDGCSLAVDAVFDRPENREHIAAAARERAVPFAGIWLEADAETLRERVRERAPGPSDATPDVLDRQFEKGTGAIEWTRVDATEPLDRIVRRIVEIAAPRRSKPSRR